VIGIGDEKYYDSIGYKDNKVEKIFHFYKMSGDGYTLTTVDSFVWAGNNITKNVRMGLNPWVETYTYDNKPNPLSQLGTIALIGAFGPRWVSENNVIAETKVNNGVSKTNTYDYKVEEGKITSIRMDINFGYFTTSNRPSYKDTVNLFYKTVNY
jgi:hypothetical protein